MTAARKSKRKHQSSRPAFNVKKWSQFSIVSLITVGIITLVLVVMSWVNAPDRRQRGADTIPLASADNNPQTDIKLDELPGQTDGKAWLAMSGKEKLDIVNRAMSNWELTGVKVSRDADWFVEVLNMFYEDNHTDTSKVKVSEAMSVLGLGGNAFTK